MGEVREGQKVKLRFKTVSYENKDIDCFIKNIHKDRLSLTIPKEVIDYSQYFEEGNELTAMIYTPLGIKVFDTIVLDSPSGSNFVIEYIENVIEIQRREYARVEFMSKVVIARSDNTNIYAETVDISGGGLKFSYKGSLDPGEVVGISLFLPAQTRLIYAKGVLVKDKGHIPEGQHVVLFTEIDERERDKIIKTCFEIQLAKYRTFDEAE